MIEAIIGSAGGFFAGTLGGLLGIGGGILLMPLLRFIMGLSPTDAVGTCILAVFFTTLGGSFRHYRLGHIDVRSLSPVIVSGALATVLFSILFKYFSGREAWLDFGIGLVFSLISMRMILEGVLTGKVAEQRPTPNEVMSARYPLKSVIGLVSGVLPGLFGIGTGAILVPAFTFVFKLPVKVAMGSSLACFSVNAFLSSVFKISQGFAVPYLALPMCLGTLMGSSVGATLNRHFPSELLKIMFGVAFMHVSVRFMENALG